MTGGRTGGRVFQGGEQEGMEEKGRTGGRV